jgi:AAHS family benzoate transporter-like MFS transporter
MRSVIVNQVIGDGRFNRFFRYIFIIAILTTITEGFDINVFGLIIPSLMKDWQLTAPQVGMLGSFGMAGMIFGSLLLGPLADKIGKAKGLMVATAIYCIFTIAVGFSTGYNYFATCRFIAGIGLAGAFPIAVAYISEYSPRKIRGRLTVWVTSGMALGTVVAVLVSLWLLSPYGWRMMFYVTAIPLLLLIFQYYLPESMSFLIKKGQNDKIAEILSKANSDFTPSKDDQYQYDAFHAGKVSLTSLFKSGLGKNTIIFWAMMFFNYIYIYAVTTWITQLMKIQGYSLALSLTYSLLYNAGFLLGIPVCGELQDKLGGKKVLSFGLIILAILTLIDSRLGPYPVPLGIFLFLTGASQHGLAGVAGSHIAQSYPLTFRGLGTGWGYGIGRFGGVCGPILGGLLLGRQFSASATFMVFACIPLISAIIIFFSTDYTKEAQNR